MQDQDYTIHKFDELQENFKEATLILGNGASIAINDCFFYNNLFDEARKSILDDKSKELFKALETTDFELVLNKLRQASIVNKALNLDSNKIVFEIYENIRRALINAVKENHIKRFEVLFQIDNIKNFMNRFKTVINLNYDLLVYWAIIASNNETPYKIKDCFIKKENNNLVFDYDVKRLRKPYRAVTDPTLVFYPHGSLILANNENNEEFKIILANENNLFDEIAKKWSNNYIPLFVSEGDSKQKERAIKRSSYLNFVYENVLVDLGRILVIYGWRLAEQDEHLVHKIFSKTNVEKVLISVHCGGNPITGKIQTDQDRIVNLLKKKKHDLEIKFFDSSSENCWCND